MYIIKSLKNKLLFASANSIFIPYIFWIYLLLILAVSCVYKWNISSRNISSFFARLYEPINHETSRLVFFWEKTRRDVLRRILWTGVRTVQSKVQFSKYISKSYKVHTIFTILHTIITPGPLELTFDPILGSKYDYGMQKNISVGYCLSHDN